jgi:hypothetical protein
MTFPDDVIKPETPSVDHAGSVLCRLLVAHPEVVGIEILGQAEMSDGIITYSLGVILPGGRELLVDVADVLLPRGRARPARVRASCSHR